MVGLLSSLQLFLEFMFPCVLDLGPGGGLLLCCSIGERGVEETSCKGGPGGLFLEVGA